MSRAIPRSARPGRIVGSKVDHRFAGFCNRARPLGAPVSLAFLISAIAVVNSDSKWPSASPQQSQRVVWEFAFLHGPFICPVLPPHRRRSVITTPDILVISTSFNGTARYLNITRTPCAEILTVGTKGQLNS